MSGAVRKRRNIERQVGLFVVAALGVLAVAVFAIGNQRSMFAAKTRLYTSFADVNGLVVGAPVRLAGVDVGRVTAIEFPEDLSRPEARLSLVIDKRYMPRVRRDSRAIIDSKGLLGDKIINLSVGSPALPPLREEEIVQPGPGGSLEQLAQSVQSSATAIGDAAHAAEGAVTSIASPEVAENLRRMTAGLADLVAAVQHGDGLAHRLIYDPAASRRLTALLANLEASSADVRSASGRLDRVLGRVSDGPGTLHTLLYRDDAHALLADVSRLTTRLDGIVQGVERGEGTLGGLLIDPSIYEDMKTILGNVERNVLFKALVRMTIKNNGIARPAQIARPMESATP